MIREMVYSTGALVGCGLARSRTLVDTKGESTGEPQMGVHNSYFSGCTAIAIWRSVIGFDICAYT